MAAKADTSPRTGLLKWSQIRECCCPSWRAQTLTCETRPWQRDNKLIITGYRHASFSYAASFRSIFRIHNETANIWSHLLGALLFVALFAHFLFWSRLPDGLAFQDGLSVGAYFTGVVVCFILSTVFNTFSDHSPRMHKCGNELDHLGIVLVLWGTGVSGTDCGFYHHHAIRNFYFALLTATAIGSGIFTLGPKFRRPAYRLMRCLMYAFPGASLFTPIVHGLFI